jgi:hypothetical protein
MDDSQFMLQGEQRHIDHPHTRNVPHRKSTPKSIHWAVVGPSSLLSFGDLPRDVVCSHEGSTGQSCSHIAKRRHKNPVAPETAIEDVHKNAAQMTEFVELKLNQFKDSKDSLVGNA